jgi:hypothetical protein
MGRHKHLRKLTRIYLTIEGELKKAAEDHARQIEMPDGLSGLVSRLLKRQLRKKNGAGIKREPRKYVGCAQS